MSLFSEFMMRSLVSEPDRLRLSYIKHLCMHIVDCFPFMPCGGFASCHDDLTTIIKTQWQFKRRFHFASRFIESMERARLSGLIPHRRHPLFSDQVLPNSASVDLQGNTTTDLFDLRYTCPRGIWPPKYLAEMLLGANKTDASLPTPWQTETLALAHKNPAHSLSSDRPAESQKQTGTLCGLHSNGYLFFDQFQQICHRVLQQCEVLVADRQESPVVGLTGSWLAKRQGV